MAASSVNAVRVRLYFDYPPPSMPDCRMSWVLVDLNKCRVVADLCSVIRERFAYSRQAVLDLFIENCFLPPAESIYVVRDNDSIRVKVSSVSCEHTGKKRHREEDGLSKAPTKKNRPEPSEANGVAQLAGTTKKKKKHKAKKKKQEVQQAESGDAFKSAVPAKEALSSKSQTDQSSKKASASSGLTNGKATPDKSSDSSDSGEEVTRKPSPPKSKSKHAQVAASKRPVARKSSSSDSSSSEDRDAVKKSQKPSTSLKTSTSTNKTPKEQTSSVPLKSTTSTSTAKKTQTQSSSDLSSSEDEASATARKADVSAKQKSTNAASKTQPQTETDSSSSEEDESRKGGVSERPKSVTSSKTNKPVLQTRPPSSSRQGEDASKKPSSNSKIPKTQTSSDSSSSSEDEASKTKVPATPKPCSDPCAVVENGVTRTPSTPVGTMLQDNKDKAERSDSCSSSDTELVIKRPNLQLMAGLTPRGRGRGFTDRVKGRGGARGGFGRARGTPWKQNFHYCYDTEEQRKQKEIQTNKSLVLQNPPEPSPRQDYSTLPLLAAPPAVGQKIAFKLLELTENYTPEVSDYKEGKIIGFNHSTNMVELELLTWSQARAEPGKFDLVYQNADGSERVEYAVTVGSQLTERWESLLEPRLIVQNN